MQINDIDLKTRIAGQAAAFVWGHGLTASMALEDELDLFDMAGEARLIRYDARGHGESQATLAAEDYEWSHLADDMLALASAAGAGQCIAGGQSMGCATALFAALAAPERVRALVLVNPPTAWETRAAQAGMYGQMAALVETQGLRALVGLLKQRPLLPQFILQGVPASGPAYLDHIAGLDPAVLPYVLRGAGLSDLPDREALRALGMPALILAWPDDATHPIATAEELDGLLPDSRLLVADSVPAVRAWGEAIRAFVTAQG